MSSYLEAYGAAEQQRARIIGIIKISSIVLACALVAGLIFYGFLARAITQARTPCGAARIHIPALTTLSPSFKKTGDRRASMPMHRWRRSASHSPAVAE
jgi:hypothetical protein